VLAARQLGIAKIPVMVAAGWSEAQKRAYVLADNRSQAGKIGNDGKPPDLAVPRSRRQGLFRGKRTRSRGQG
jgi:hypothetical protein